MLIPSLTLKFIYFLCVQYQVYQQEGGSSRRAREVLERGIKQHPSSSHLKLELAQCTIKEADTDAQIMRGDSVDPFSLNF